MGINNAFYEELDEKWYTAFDHPIALLRAENKIRIPWILETIGRDKKILDIGCGAGLLANALAKEGHEVFGVDLSPSTLKIAKKHDATQTVVYDLADAAALPYPTQTFDVVSAMDLLEHVENPQQVISEASRVLKPGGLFFFHTFNRNPLSYLLIIKGVDWCVPNAPKNMHIYRLFIKPSEMEKMGRNNSLKLIEMKGFIPKLSLKTICEMTLQKKVPEHFTFRFSKSLATGYCGYFRKGEIL